MKKPLPKEITLEMLKTLVRLDEMVERKVLTVPKALSIAFSEGMRVALCVIREKLYKSTFQ